MRTARMSWCSWRKETLYKLKPGDDGNPPRYKAHIAMKGFQHKKGVDFDDIFSLVVKMTSIRTVLSIATNMDLEVEKLDVKTIFRHGNLQEEIYIHQPEGFVEKGMLSVVSRKLSKAERNYSMTEREALGMVYRVT